MGSAFKPIIFRTVKQLPESGVADHYRAMVIGPGGEVVRVHGFFAEKDDIALQHAQQFAAFQKVYIWKGGRLVGKLKAMKTGL
jgi:hypothetical protein